MSHYLSDDWWPFQSLWGGIYAWCIRAGKPPGLALVAAGCVGAVLPGLLHRTVRATDWEVRKEH